jgi:hypothetical protein
LVGTVLGFTGSSFHSLPVLDEAGLADAWPGLRDGLGELIKVYDG